MTSLKVFKTIPNFRRTIQLGVIFLNAILTTSTVPAQKRAKTEYGMTVHEFQEFAAALPRLPGRIVAIKFLAGRSGNVPDTVGVLTYNEKNGWQVAVFDRRRDHRFVLDWSSGKLDSSFAGSDPDAMENVPGAGEDLIVFHGCAPHTCPDVFAYLLYVPSKRKAFEAHYLRGKTTYSPELNKPENKEYLEVLQQEIKYNREGAPQ